MTKLIKKIGPWYFPESDTLGASASIQEARFIEDDWLKHCSGLKVCVQAGGNCGLFPSKLAVYFDAVYTAEPELENFVCLALNCPSPNVYAFRAAFGRDAGPAGLHLVEGNGGGHYLDGAGSIPVIRIDSLALKACDLIALDVEGAELLALQGAEETITRFHPTLVIEDKGHVTRFGQTTEALHEWVESRGYVSRGFAWRDHIWVHP